MFILEPDTRELVRLAMVRCQGIVPDLHLFVADPTTDMGTHGNPIAVMVASGLLIGWSSSN